MLTFTNLSVSIKDNLTSWETFEEQTKECHRQLDLADTEFASIKKVFDLDTNKSVYETHKATGASFRSTIEALFKLVNDSNNTIQCKYLWQILLHAIRKCILTVPRVTAWVLIYQIK